MRRICGTLLFALPLLLAAPAQASDALVEREALRAVLTTPATAADRSVRLPLALPVTRRPAVVPATIARAQGSQRVLVGARSHRQLPRLRDVLRRLGARVETIAELGVLSADVPSGATLARALRSEHGVAYVERDRALRVAADPFDAPDPAHGGLNFSWAYDEVRAAAAIAAAGGGSRRIVAIVDTGLDITHADLIPNLLPGYDTTTGDGDVTDFDGHGTFVAGLIAATDGNGIGGKGVAGATRVLPVRASADGRFALSDVVRGLAFAVRQGADVVNLSLTSDGLDATLARALDLAFYANVLPVAASGNKALNGNPLQFPAAFVGARRGGRSIGLSVAATKPGGTVASFSDHNAYVSVAAPGASDDCRKGVFSTIPRQTSTQWDIASPCPMTVFSNPGGRWAYAQGTSFSAPIAAGIAALVWQVEPRLASEQVADVIRRSARQTIPGPRWNEFTGSGIVDGAAATALARRYDVRSPRARARARQRGARVLVTMRPSRDRTEPGRELAGQVRYGLLASRNGGESFDYLVRPRRRPVSGGFAVRGRQTNVFVASACDGNGNCGVKRLGRFRR